MPVKKTVKDIIKKKKVEARKLYSQGLTTREIGIILSRSRQWVSNVINEKGVNN